MAEMASGSESISTFSFLDSTPTPLVASPYASVHTDFNNAGRGTPRSPPFRAFYDAGCAVLGWWRQRLLLGSRQTPMRGPLVAVVWQSVMAYGSYVGGRVTLYSRQSVEWNDTAREGRRGAAARLQPHCIAEQAGPPDRR